MIKCCRFVKVDSLRQHLSVQDEITSCSGAHLKSYLWTPDTRRVSDCCTAKTAVIQTSAAPQVSVSVYLWWVFLQSETWMLNAQLCKLFCKRKAFVDTSVAAWKSRRLCMQLSASPEAWQDFSPTPLACDLRRKSLPLNHEEAVFSCCCIYKAWDCLCSKRILVVLALGAYHVLASSKFSTEFAFNVGKPKLL